MLHFLYHSFSKSICVVMASRSLWSLCILSLHYTKKHVYKIYRRFLLMQACAAGYALTYFMIVKLQVVSWTIVGLTAAKFKPLILPMHGFYLSNTMYIWIYMVHTMIHCSEATMQFAENMTSIFLWCGNTSVGCRYSRRQPRTYDMINIHYC
jgi:hypothetical protein